MDYYLSLWWVWIGVALALGILELVAPGFIFLGFAVGAVATSALVFVLPTTNVAAILAIFAILSLIGWIGLRMIFRRQSSGTRVVTHDINDN